jgi:hypothetical protein
MKLLQTLLATVLVLMMLGCATPVSAQIETNMENPKFLRYGEAILGLNETEVTEALGRPYQVLADDCIVPYQPPGAKDVIPVTGNSWVYTFQGQSVRASLILCMVRGHAVAERRNMGAVEGSKVYTNTSEVIDFDLIERAYTGELDESNKLERINPSIFRGPKYEI